MNHSTRQATRMAVFLIGLVMLSGCAKKVETPPVPQGRPALSVPKSFPSDQAKRDFAFQAIEDSYYAEAQALLTEVVTSAPDALSYVKLGTSRYMLENYAGATEAWLKASEINPALASEMNNNIGNALRDAKKSEEAVAAYEKALELDPTEWQAAVNLADLLKSEGKLAEAIQVLERSQVANPKEASLYTIASSYKKQVSAVQNTATP